MLDIKDFEKKQIVVYCPYAGDKISYRNDNMRITDIEGKTKYQISCYCIFMLLVIGDCSITTGFIRRAKKFGFSVCFMTYSFKLYAKMNAGLEGNFYLHQKQYEYSGTELARKIIENKIKNQYLALKKIRKKTEYIKEGLIKLQGYIGDLDNKEDIPRDTILGIEGNASKVYFARVFDEMPWKGRKPRIKQDYINSILDIGYNILFNFVDSLLQVYDFDVYKGVLHTCFYMRKSLVCDLMEPFRPIIDLRVRKGINLGQFKKEDFVEIKGQWQLDYKKSSLYSQIFMEELLKNKDNMFIYFRSYYRAFMKGKETKDFPEFVLDGE